VSTGLELLPANEFHKGTPKGLEILCIEEERGLVLPILS